MDDAVTVKYFYKDEVSRMGGALVRAVPRLRWTRRLGICLLAVELVSSLVTVLRHGPGALQSSMWIPFGCGLALTGYSWVIEWGIRWQFSRSEMWKSSMEWRITPQGFDCKCGEALRWEFSWKLVVRLEREKEGFLVFMSAIAFHWLPYAGFGDAGQVGAFLEMARAAGVKLTGGKQ